MNDIAKEVTEYIMSDMLQLWHILMDSDYAVNTKVSNRTTLKNSNLDNQAKVDNNEFKFNLFYNNYLEYVENGRKIKETKVPIAPLIDWMKRKHIANGDVSVAYAIRESIYDRGIPARPLLTHYGDMIDDKFINEWSDRIFQTITNNIDKYFK